MLMPSAFVRCALPRVLTGLCGALLTAQLWAADTKTLTIGVENLYYLPISQYSNGQYQGFARELLDAFAKDQGYKIEYRALPVPRLYSSFFEGEIDFKFPDNPNWQADKRAGKPIVYSEPVAQFVDGVLVPANHPQRKTLTPDQIRTLGTVSGFTPWAWLDRIKAGKTTLTENTNLESLSRQVLAGRVDGAYANVAVMNHHLDHVANQPGALVFASQLPHSRDAYFLSSQRRPEVIKQFAQWQKAHKGWIDELKLKHNVEKGIYTQLSHAGGMR